MRLAIFFKFAANCVNARKLCSHYSYAFGEFTFKLNRFSYIYASFLGTAVAQSLRCCAISRKVAVSIPAGVIRIFH